MRTWFICSISLLACTCKSPASVVDAGTVVERGTDLRTALTTVFPEYRGAQLTAGRCAVTRFVRGAGKKEDEQVKATATANGFSGDPLMRKPFVLRTEVKPDGLELEVSMGFAPDEMPRILSAPTSMSSEALAHWLPKLPQATTREVFEFEVVWMSKDVARADFLVWQMVEGALSAGWTSELPTLWQHHRPDGGAGEVPVEFSLVLRQAALGAVIELDRKDDRAKLRYLLTTFERK